MPLDAGVLTSLLSGIVLLLALTLGPLPIVIRGVIRQAAGPQHVHRWAGPAAIGVSLGMILAALVVALGDADQTVYLVLFCLLVLLAIIDWQWHWLPIEWTLSVLAIGLINGAFFGDLLTTLIQIIIPALVLLGTRYLMQVALSKDALGLGDVWLIAGLGAFLPVTNSFLLVGLAALTGLFEVVLRWWFRLDRQKTLGVSYGTHLCVVFLILQSFPRFI